MTPPKTEPMEVPPSAERICTLRTAVFQKVAFKNVVDKDTGEITERLFEFGMGAAVERVDLRGVGENLVRAFFPEGDEIDQNVRETTVTTVLQQITHGRLMGLDGETHEAAIFFNSKVKGKPMNQTDRVMLNLTGALRRSEKSFAILDYCLENQPLEIELFCDRDTHLKRDSRARLEASVADRIVDDPAAGTVRINAAALDS